MGATRTRPCSRTTTRRPPIPRTRISPGRTSRRSSSGCACAHVALAPARRGARDQAIRPRRGRRQSPACARALRAARTLGALARDRPRERTQVRRRALLGGDEARSEADRRPGGAGGHPGRPRCQTSIRSGMWPRAPTRGGRGLDSAGARAGRAGQHGARAGADRPRVLESVGGACCGPRRERARRALGRPRPPLLCLGRACFGRLRRARLRAILRVGARRVDLLPEIADPGPPDRDLRGADPAVRADRPLPGGAAARRGACRDLAAAHSPPPHPLDRDGARGEGADGRVDVDPGAQRRSSSVSSPRTSTRRASGTRARCSSKRSPRVRRRARHGAPARGARRWRSPSRASASGSSARASGWRCCATSSTSSRR